MAVLMKIPVTKAGRSIEVDTDSIPEDMYQLALEEGLKVLLNKGLSGDKYRTKDLEGEDLEKAREAVFAKALENFENLKAGNLKRGRTTAKTVDGKKVPGVVMTEARRLAKEVIKDEIRAAGKKISHFEPREITAYANELIASDPSFIEKAAANIEARTAIKSANFDLDALKESPKLVARAEKAKAERKTQLSAKQAGKPAPRKPKAEQHAGH